VNLPGKRCTLFIAAIALGMTVSFVHADSVMGVNDSFASFGPWQSYWGNATVTPIPSGGSGGGAGWLNVTFTNTAAETPDSTWRDIAYTPSTNLFAGTWTTNNWITFDFYQSNVVAGGLAVVFGNTNNSDIWSYSLTPTNSTGIWSTYMASFGDTANWTYPFADTSQYLADLSAINWIGLYIYRDTTGQQVYGIDSVKLMVPEPAESVLLVAAMISSAIALRRKRRAKAASTA
jgi:hypothetical protein